MTDLLTRTDEITLARTMECGLMAEAVLDDPGLLPQVTASTAELRQLVAAGREARAEFIEANRRLVAWEAHRWASRKGLDVDELIQEGCLGLVEAVDRWDYQAGFTFATYALHWIRNHLQRAAANRCGELPVSVQACLRHRRGTLPQATALQVEALMATHSIHAVQGEYPLAAPEHDDDDALVAQVIALMTPQERRLVMHHYGLTGRPRTMRQTARDLGLTRRYADALEEAAFHRVRAKLGILAEVA